MTQTVNQKFSIDEADANKRLDIFLAELFSDLSRTFIQKQIKSGNVLVNNKLEKVSYVLKTDDCISMHISSECEYSIQPENIPIDILYEDSRMLVVNKPSGMLTHPTAIEKSGTLVNALLHKYGNNLSDCNGLNRPGIVHRLDRNTSGLLMIAKTNDAYEFLKKQMQEHNIEKKYYAVVSPYFETLSGTINEPIGRHPSKPEKMAVVYDGKPSVTHYKVLENFSTASLLEIVLETGRTHQIRVHMSHIGHPIVNDSMYGGRKFPVKTQEQVLQAFSLKFTSPEDMSEHIVTIGFDDDIIRTLNYLRSKK